MKRRSFLQSAVAASAMGAVGHSSNANAAPPAERRSGFRTKFNDAFAIFVTNANAVGAFLDVRFVPQA
jgi:hypothetical protein